MKILVGSNYRQSEKRMTLGSHHTQHGISVYPRTTERCRGTGKDELGGDKRNTTRNDPTRNFYHRDEEKRSRLRGCKRSKKNPSLRDVAFGMAFSARRSNERADPSWGVETTLENAIRDRGKPTGRVHGVSAR